MPSIAKFRPPGRLLLAATLLACGTEPTPDHGPEVGVLAVTPAQVTLRVGELRQLTVDLRDPAGAPMPHSLILWETTAPQVAAVDGLQRVAAWRTGSATITATVGSVRDVIQVEVTTVPSVANVDVQPVSAALLVSESVQLSATPRDAAGALVPGRTATWSSDAPGVASVDGNGLARGVAEGTARITATIDGKSDQSTLFVSEQGSGSGAWPNEPAGYTAVTDQPWSLLTTLGWVLQFGTALVGLDLLAPASPPGVLTIEYPVGFVGGSAPGTLTRTITPSRRLFTGLWWKPSDPWQGHESNVNKLQFFFAETGGDITMVMYGSPGGPYQLRVIPQFPGLASNWLIPNVATVPVTLGEWHRVEWLIDYADVVGSGRVRWWLDGQLIGDHHNVPFPDGGLFDYKISPTWGGVGDVKEQVDHFWFDHTYLSHR